MKQGLDEGRSSVDQLSQELVARDRGGSFFFETVASSFLVSSKSLAMEKVWWVLILTFQIDVTYCGNSFLFLAGLQNYFVAIRIEAWEQCTVSYNSLHALCQCTIV